MMKFKEIREGSELMFKTFLAADRTRYLVFKSLDGSFHVFAEVEAKQAAQDCGAFGPENANTRQLWDSLWDKQP